jgi:hypothetical protein
MRENYTATVFFYYSSDLLLMRVSKRIMIRIFDYSNIRPCSGG